LFANRPAMKFCLPFIAGAVIGWCNDLPLVPVYVLTCLLAALAAAALLALTDCPMRHLLQLCLVFSFGLLKITFDSRLVPASSVSNFTGSQKVLLEGVVADAPRVKGEGVQFVLNAVALASAGRMQAVNGGVMVYGRVNKCDTTVLSSLSYGSRLYLVGELAGIGSVRNPGEFDFSRYFLLNGICAKFYPTRIDPLSLGSKPERDIQAMLVYPVRRSVSERLERFIGGEEAQFLKGLLIGERSDISADVKNAFINSGVLHIIAVSGLHVVVVVFIIFMLLRILRVGEKTRIIITCLFLFYYIFLTGAAASVARSVIMAALFMCAGLLERRSDIYNTLGFSAMLLVLFDAKQLFQPGFQLSFVAVFSLVYLYPKVYGLKRYLPPRLRNSRIALPLIAAVSVSVAAGIGTLPFTSLYFGKISVVSFLANVIVVPLSNVILALGMFMIGLSYIWSPLAGVYAECTSLLTWLLLRCVQFLGSVPFAYVESRFSLIWSIIFYAFVSVLINFRRKDLRKYILLGSLVLLNIWLFSDLLTPYRMGALRVTFLDVGQGDSALLEFPDGETILVDAGPRTQVSDAGARFILPYLKYRGVKRLSALVITHLHNDHIGGVPYLLRNFKVGEIIQTGSNVKSQGYTECLRMADSLSIPRTFKKAGDKVPVAENIRVYVLNPPGVFINSGGVTRKAIHPGGENNMSLVLKVCYGKTSLYLPGDAEREVNERIASSYGSFASSGVYKLGHHGSSNGWHRKLYSLIKPEFSVISVGARNKFGHPSPEVIEELSRCGSSYYRTDERGAVVLESDGSSWHLIEWK